MKGRKRERKKEDKRGTYKAVSVPFSTSLHHSGKLHSNQASAKLNTSALESDGFPLSETTWGGFRLTSKHLLYMRTTQGPPEWNWQYKGKGAKKTSVQEKTFISSISSTCFVPSRHPVEVWTKEEGLDRCDRCEFHPRQAETEVLH